MDERSTHKSSIQEEMVLERRKPHLSDEQNPEPGEGPTKGLVNDTESALAVFCTVQCWVPRSVPFRWKLTALQLHPRQMELLERTETVYKENRSLNKVKSKALPPSFSELS